MFQGACAKRIASLASARADTSKLRQQKSSPLRAALLKTFVG